jgi:hypothetical protein
MTSDASDFISKLTTFSQRDPERRVRLFAFEPSVLEAYLIFEAFRRKSEVISLHREAQVPERWVLCEPGVSLSTAFESFFQAICTKDLNSLNVVDEHGNFSYFDWDDRFFLLGGVSDFLRICCPMPIYVSRMHFEAIVLNSPDEEYLLKLWDSVAHLM